MTVGEAGECPVSSEIHREGLEWRCKLHIQKSLHPWGSRPSKRVREYVGYSHIPLPLLVSGVAITCREYAAPAEVVGQERSRNSLWSCPCGWRVVTSRIAQLAKLSPVMATTSAQAN